MDQNSRKQKPTKDAKREDRLKAALKANLSRRKAQAKARSAEPSGDSGIEQDKG